MSYKRLDYEVDGVRGARIIVAREPMFPWCMSEGEIDANVKALKNDLDKVVSLAKKALAEQLRKPDF